MPGRRSLSGTVFFRTYHLKYCHIRLPRFIHGRRLAFDRENAVSDFGILLR